MKQILLLAAVFILAVSAIPKPFEAYPEHLYNKHLKLWNIQRDATQIDTVTFWIALHQRNLNYLDELFWKVSDPTSPQYTDYLTTEEILAIIEPPKAVQQQVLHFLSTFDGIIEVENCRDAIKVVATAPAVEKIFQTKLYVFENEKTGHTAVRQIDGFTIPAEIARHVQFVSGLTEFPYPQKTPHSLSKPNKGGPSPQQTYQYIIPQSVRDLYGIPATTVVTNPKTSQGVVEFIPEYAPDFSDMVSFATQAGETFTNISVIVGGFLQEGSGESTLDVELLYNIGSKGKNWYWTVSDGWAYEMALEIFVSPQVPQVISISYGWPEIYTCQSAVTQAHCNSTVQDYVTRANTELQKLGLRGISVLIATQDEGAPSEANIDCSLDNTDMPVFAIYPSSSPFVTAVSATTVMPDSSRRWNSNNPEADPPICNGYGCAHDGYEVPCMTNNTQYTWTTGGGFSVYGAMPAYQKAAVANWFAQGGIAPPTSLFPYQNRGYADVTAVGARILIVDGGVISVSAGTSASTPIFSGVVTLLNDRRWNNNKKPLGFLNVLLYQMAAANPKAFNDVTQGNNKCTEGYCCTYGYGATHGWDPVSGLGSPNWPEMIQYVDQLR